VSAITSTFFSLYRSAGLQELPHLTEREREAVVAAIDAGTLVPVVDIQPIDGSTIVAVVAPEHVERFCAERDEDAHALLSNRLAELGDELDNLLEIVREVMAEKRPSECIGRIEDCIDDARELLARVETAAEEI
jgi:hypothetical protein